MANGIDVGDALPTLEQGQADAEASFKSLGGDNTSVAPPPPAPVKHRGPTARPKQGISLGDPTADDMAATQTDPNQDGIPYDKSTAAPAPKQADIKAATEDNELWSAASVKHFLRDTFKGTGAELEQVGVRTLAGVADLVASFGSAPIAKIIDNLNNAQADAKAKLEGKPANNQSGQTSRIADKVFDFRKDYILPIVKNWTPDRAEHTGQDQGSGGTAQAIGTGIEGAAPMLAGAAALPLMVGKGVQSTAFDAIDRGEDPKTALATGMVDGLGGILQAKFGVVPSLSLLKRVVTAIPLGDLMKVTTDYAKKFILEENGYHDHAKQVNPWEDLGPASIENALFGVIGGHKKAEDVKVPEPTPAAAEPTMTAPSKEGAAPATAEPVPASAVPAPPAAAAPAKVPDQPSAESSKDLRAQITDMNDKATPRVGVLISTDSHKILAGSKDVNAASVNGTLNQARTQGRTIDMPQGTLLLKSKKIADATKERLAKGEDPQAVIGTVTGAGEGKSPEQTVVVQGHTEGGNVAAETAVAPEAVPQAVQKMVDQGKTPVVTTPEAAVQRRIDEISKERNAPAQMGIMTTPSGKEVAVHVESGASDGFTRVRAIDADGEPSEHTVDVPADRIKISKASDGTGSDGPPTKPIAPEPTAKAEGTPTGHETQGVETEDKPLLAPSDPTAKDLKVVTERRSKANDTDNARRVGDEPQDMTKSKEERAAERARVAAERAKEEGHSGELEPEPVPANAAKTEGEQVKRDAETDEEAMARLAKKPVETETPEQLQARLDKEADARGKDTRTREEVSTAAMKEAGKKPILKAVKPKSALESLSTALESHESQEQIPEGKKFAASLSERQDNASAFAAVLREAANSARGKASVTDIERATRAAKAAERLTDKGKAATEKGQGTGHTRVTALVNEMHKAARSLLGTAREGDGETVAPKAAELKAKVEKAKVKGVAREPAEALTEREQKAAKLAELKAKAEAKKAKAEAKAKIEAEKVQVPVNEKYKADIKAPKPKEPAASSDDQKKIQRLSDKFIWAENGKDTKAARAEVEQFLHEKFADKISQEDRDNILHLLEERRHKENPDSVMPRAMSDTIEDEEHVLEIDKDSGFQRGGREHLSIGDELKSKLQRIRDAAVGDRMHREWDKLGENAKPLLHTLAKALDTGQPISSHEILGKMISHADTPILKSVLENIRSHAPDLPVYMVSKVKSLDKQNQQMSHAAGLFSRDSEAIQGTFSRDAAFTLRTLVHEMRHAATDWELSHNPNGELAAQSRTARDMLIRRLAAKYGTESIKQHLEYFKDPTQPKPEGYKRELYGIHNIKEMHAELDNPNFLREIAQSESHAQPGENIPKASGGLLGKIYAAIGKFFGVSNPRLLTHIADIHERTMATQASESVAGGRFEHLEENGRDATQRHNELMQVLQKQFGQNILQAQKSVAELDAIVKPPKETKQIRDISEAAGESASLKDDERPISLASKVFKHAVDSKAMDFVRNTKINFKRVDQIMRDYRKDFGHTLDKTNPMIEYEDVQSEGNKVKHRLHAITRPVAEAWGKLPEDVNLKLGQLMKDVTSYRIDPRKGMSEQVAEVADDSKAAARHAEYQQRLNALPKEAQKVFSDALDSTKIILREVRKAGVDAALHTFTEGEITDAQRSLLYSARTREAFDELVGKDKLIDVSDRNDSLCDALKSFAAHSEMAGPYMHLGRTGDYVVTAKPEGSQTFASKDEADKFSATINTLSPGSKAKYAEVGGKHTVDYKADYTSFHETRNDAEIEADKMRKLGLDVGNVTTKTMTQGDALGKAASNLLSEATRKITQHGSDEGTQAMTDALRSAFLQMSAARSAYAGSKLARKASAGVKAKEMRKNYSDWAQSTIWHTAQMRTVFDQANALARLRGSARDSSAPQDVAYRRGEAVSALNRHMQDEVASYGYKSPFNNGIAKLGFMSYLASPSHAFIWMTQNFSTGIPVAGARWGYGKATSSFMSAMSAVTGPAFKQTMFSAYRVLREGGGSAQQIHEAIMKGLDGDKRWGKWVKGENSPFQKLIDMGVIDHSYSEAVANISHGENKVMNRVMEFARVLPNMADAWNRVSTALAALEMTGGDIRKTADFVREVHADYSAENKPLAFKQISRLPLGNSVVAYKTYTQNMAHLLYGGIADSIKGDNKFESAKSVAGMIVGTALFTGIYSAAALEPLRLAVYAYHKIFDDEGEAFDLKNAVNTWIQENIGGKLGKVAQFGLPNALGFDLSSRMGLGELFFHDMPDLLSNSKDNWKQFIYNESGTMTSFLADRVTSAYDHLQKGEPFQAVSSLIPIKQYQDAVKAHQLYTTGKLNSLGASMTEPSAADAALQFLGLKPASVAEAQEHGRVSVEYMSQIKATRQDIVKSYVTGDKQDAMARLNAFNRLHPAEKIGRDELMKELVLKRKIEMGTPSRDSELNQRQRF